MTSVSQILIKTIKDIQELPSLKTFALGGGTNLGLRYNHRISIDISQNEISALKKMLMQ